jgi:hypothetical protein
MDVGKIYADTQPDAAMADLEKTAHRWAAVLRGDDLDTRYADLTIREVEPHEPTVRTWLFEIPE